jgi:hypothetical protein
MILSADLVSGDLALPGLSVFGSDLRGGVNFSDFGLGGISGLVLEGLSGFVLVDGWHLVGDASDRVDLSDFALCDRSDLALVDLFEFALGDLSDLVLGGLLSTLPPAPRSVLRPLSILPPVL